MKINSSAQNNIGLNDQIELLAKMGTWSLDIKTYQLTWSDGIFKMLDYKAQEFETTHEKGLEIIHPLDRKEATQLMEQALATGKSYSTKKRLISKDGNIIHVRSTAQVIEDAEGTPLKLIGIFQDISEFVNSEQVIEDQNTLFHDLIKKLPSAFFLFNQQGEHLLWNEKLEKSTGYNEEEIARFHPDDFYEGEEKDKINSHIHTVLEEGYHETQVWLTTKNKVRVPFYFTSSTIQHKGEKCVFGTATDISERLSLLDELQLLINNTEEAFMYCDKKLNVISFNEQMKSHCDLIFKNTLKKGRNLVQLVSKEQQDEFHNIIKDVNAGTIVKTVLKNDHNAELNLFELSFKPVLNDNHELEGIFLTSSDETERFEYQSALQESHERLELVMKTGYECIWEYDVPKKKLYLGESFLKAFGAHLVETDNNIDLHDALVHPKDLVGLKRSIIAALINPAKEEWESQYRLLKEDGNYAVVKDRAIIIREAGGRALKMAGGISDITKEYRTKKTSDLEKELLTKSISTEKPLAELLEHYLLGLEDLFNNMRVSILKVEDGKLRNLSSPSLPQQYVQDLEGLTITLNQESSGTEAYLKKKIIVSDIFNDERWRDLRQYGEKFGFAACWSLPIFDWDGNLMATFAIYHKESKEPDDFEINLFDKSSKLISVIFQNCTHIETLKLNQERFKFINKATNNAIYDWDIEQKTLEWGKSLKRVFGHDSDQRSFTLEDWSDCIHPDDSAKVLQNLEAFMVDQTKTKWSLEYRFKKANGQYAYVEDVGYMIRDEKGSPRRMIGAVRDQTQIKQEHLKQEIQQEISLIFKSNESLFQSLKTCLKYVTEFSNFSLGEIWLTKQDQKSIRLTAKYSRTSAGTSFHNNDLPKQFQLGQGLAGSVLEHKKHCTWEDLAENLQCIRTEAAKKAGLTSALAYPLFNGNTVIGVALFMHEKGLGYLEQEFNIFKVLEKFLGEEIRRKQQQEELELLFESAPDIFAVLDPNRYFIKVNPAFCKLTGYSAEELTSKPYTHFLHPEDSQTTENEHLEIISEKKQAGSFVNRFRTKSGKYISISWNNSEGFGPENHVFAFGRDITESLKLQQNLQNATQLASLGAWEVNLTTGESYWSPMMKTIHEAPSDYTPDLEEAISFYHPDFQRLLEDSVEEAIKTGNPFDFEAKIITANQNERWVRSMGNAELRDENCIRLYGSVQDIHEKKIMEKRLTDISDNVPGVLFRYHLKPDGTDFMDHVSNGARKMWGLSPESAMKDINQVWEGIEEGGELEKVRAAIAESAENLSRFHLTWRYIKPNGDIRYHICDANPEKTADGTTIWDTIITDATDLQYYERLAKRISQIAKVGSWELNLPKDQEALEVYWSPVTRQILEVSSDYNPSITGGSEFYTEESKAVAETAIHNLFTQGEKFDLALLIKTQTGKRKWVRIIGDCDSINGQVARIIGSIQDIDQQKRTELAVQELLAEKEEILESIGDVFFAVDEGWNITYWNKEAEIILGKKREDILTKNLWGVLGLNQEDYKQYVKAIETQQQFQFEEYFSKLHKCFEISAYPSEKGLSVFFKDITRRKEAEETLKIANDRFELAALATNDAIWDWDIIADKTTRAGIGFEKQFGYTEETAEFDLDLWRQRVHPEDLQTIINSRNNTLNDHKTNYWVCEYRFRKKNGKYAVVVDRAHIVRNTNGKATRMIGVTTDITNQKKYEESLMKINDLLRKQTHALKMSNDELEQFAYVASHDLQEPLRMVTGFLSQLEKKYASQLDEKAHQYINFATDGAKRMSQIILDLLDFSRVGKEKEKTTEVDLNEIVNEVCLLNRKKIEEVNAEVSYNNLPTIQAHPTIMIQLFQNLINNGIKYSRENINPQLSVKAEEFENEWKFSVEDNGIGIEEQYFDQVFTIFQRLHNRDKFSGTGMGLAIVKKIIENYNGRIWINSEVGRGTTFHFTLGKI